MVTTSPLIQRRHIHVDGVVQGVGFRPFIYGLAIRHGLTGWVMNSSAGVDIEVQGSISDLDAFQTAIIAEAPRLARIDRVEGQSTPVIAGDDTFAIHHSAATGGISLVSPDVATCPDCLAEVFDPANRRYRYPFTNCTNCGPRYTIIQTMPYDRPQTTMCQFTMCLACQHEYDNPLDRRFHAQPNACPVCGPLVELVADDALLASLDPDLPDDLARTAALLRAGYIVAIRGLGGFHLACDAANADAVARLRACKARPDKPFAVMMVNLDQIRAYCETSEDEERLLASISAPVVLLYTRPDTPIAPGVAPGNPMLGVMLPYTPLHHILLHDADVPLVMTSGNLSEMPIITENNEALKLLAPIADAFLLHNRPIHMRCDDAVWWVDHFAGEQDAARQPLRRSRGDAPYPVRLAWESPCHILATGAEMKNTLCLIRESDAFLSQHIGEVDSLEALDYFTGALAHLKSIFKVQPGLIVHDLHPGYLTTRLAYDLAEAHGIEKVAAQHHHAHIAACLAEHGYADPVIGVAFDGTGYGPDGAIWGGEILVADLAGYERAAHLEYLPLPGGEAAIRRPYRTAWGYLLSALGEIPDLPALADYSDQEREIVARQVERGFNSPPTSSCGRLFDAVSALIGLCPVTTFEAQAAIALELAARQADPDSAQPYPFMVDPEGVIRLGDLLATVVRDVRMERPASQIAADFHLTIGEMIGQAAEVVRVRTGIETVALSGGVFQNRLVLRLTRDRLRAAGFTVLTHRQVPANDGGLSLGQAVIGLWHAR
jgi:hydrogenase maturation protein HypF